MSVPKTIASLLVAPLGAMVEVGVLSIVKGGDNSRPQGLVIILLITALVCYASELLFVVPLMVVWPRLRQPSVLFAAVWGVLVAWCVWSLWLGATFLWPGATSVARSVPLVRVAAAFALIGSFGLFSG